MTMKNIIKKKIFIVKDICPFDLLRWEKDTFYNLLDQEYNKRFNTNIEILEADLYFVKDGIKVKITNYTNL